jgi:hypothetical protein
MTLKKIFWSECMNVLRMHISGLVLALALLTQPTSMAADYTIEVQTIHSGYDGKMCWVHPRSGTIPGETPTVVLTMQKLLLSGSDIFYALNEMRTDDLGGTWSSPKEHDTLGRRANPDGGASVA